MTSVRSSKAGASPSKKSINNNGTKIVFLIYLDRVRVNGQRFDERPL